MRRSSWLAGGEVVLQDVCGRGLHGVADLERAPRRVIRGAYYDQDGHAVGEVEAAAFFGAGHPSGHFLDEVIQDMTGVLQPGIDPARAGVRLNDRRACCDRQRQRRDRELDRTTVGEVTTRTR